jgi:hypothetical protein
MGDIRELSNGYHTQQRQRWQSLVRFLTIRCYQYNIIILRETNRIGRAQVADERKNMAGSSV